MPAHRDTLPASRQGALEEGRMGAARIGNGLEETILPLFEETASVSKRKLVTGVVRVTRKTLTRETEINDVLARQTIEIDRRPVGVTVDAVPAIRTEGDTIIVPIVEETIVVERRLVLKEEVHLKQVLVNEPFSQRVELRAQYPDIERRSVAPTELETDGRVLLASGAGPGTPTTTTQDRTEASRSAEDEILGWWVSRPIAFWDWWLRMAGAGARRR